jgi:hypothetical protein
MKKILQYVDPASVIMFVLAVPFLFFFGHILQDLQPASLYYSSLSAQVAGIPLCVPFILLIAACWSALRLSNKFLEKRSRVVKGFGRAALVAGILGADLLSMMAGMVLPRRLEVGDAYCDLRELGTVERCEGRDVSFLQDRLSGVIRFGTAAPDIIKKIETYPDYNLFQTDCTQLGDFGDTCYAGRYERATADVNYMNIYLHKDKILILETENIVVNGAVGDEPAFLPEDKPKLEDFVRIERFKKDMTE